MDNLGRLIIKQRAKLDISQGCVAVAIGYTNSQFISNVERGICSVPDTRLLALANILQIELDRVIVAKVQDYRDRIIARANSDDAQRVAAALK